MEKLIEIINNSELPHIEKTVIKFFIEKAKREQDYKEKDRQLIEQIVNEKRISEVLISNDEVKIYKVEEVDEWSIKYPFRIIIFNNIGKWESSSIVSPTIDIAMLVYLGIKYLGHNSNFHEYAVKMLGIKID